MAVRSYVCPGDAHAISRSTHLARLAADFDQCAGCPYRDDLGGISLPPPARRVVTPLQPLLERERLWRPLRDRDARRDILEHCDALASLLWNETPWQMPVNEWLAAETPAASRPAVCVGWGESETSQSFAADVIRTIRRNGCRVLSIGVVSRPMLDFAVDHLDAAAGVWVEGGGSPAGVGIRVVSGGSLSWSADGRLGAIVQHRACGIVRPSRTAGGVTSFDVAGAYRESVLRHFAGVPRVDLSVAGMGRATQAIWLGLTDRTHCRLESSAIESPHQKEPGASVLRSLQEEIVRGRFRGGAVLGDDGRQLWLIDRRDGLLADRQIAELLLGELLGESANRELRVVAAEELMWTSVGRSATRLVTCGASEEEIVTTMKRHQASLGCDGAGRFWIARPTIRCDALVTLAYLVRSMSAEGSSSQPRAA